VFSLQGKDASKPAGNWFRLLMAFIFSCISFCTFSYSLLFLQLVVASPSRAVFPYSITELLEFFPSFGPPQAAWTLSAGFMLCENQSPPTPFAIYTAYQVSLAIFLDYWPMKLIITDQVASALYPGGALFRSWSALRSYIWCRGEKLVALYLYSAVLFVCLFLVQQTPVGQDLLIHEVSRSNTTTHHSQ
jgi:hypothetical protein